MAGPAWRWEAGPEPWPSDPVAPAAEAGRCLAVGPDGAWTAVPCSEGRGAVCELAAGAGQEGETITGRPTPPAPPRTCNN